MPSGPTTARCTIARSSLLPGDNSFVSAQGIQLVPDLSFLTA